ncbi:MAG: hypothetical protein ABW217_11685, partial [Polyangiaceae bacterium]
MIITSAEGSSTSLVRVSLPRRSDHRALALALSCAIPAVAACASDTSGAGSAGSAATLDGGTDTQKPENRVDDVLLVHGAWADGSSWSRVIELLQRDGFA